MVAGLPLALGFALPPMRHVQNAPVVVVARLALVPSVVAVPTEQRLSDVVVPVVHHPLPVLIWHQSTAGVVPM
jgi:hypothetical protein